MKNISFFNTTRHKCVILGLLTYLISHNPIWSQCPTPVNNNFRNNGTGGSCLSGITIPAGKQHTGRFTFQNGTGPANNQYLDKVLLNGQLYQEGQTLYNNLGTIWFGGYNASSKDLCFYGISNNNNAVPAGRWTLFFRDVITGALTNCIYTIDNTGNSSSFSAGAISGGETICTGSAASTITSSSNATSCASPTYQWRQSTTSSTNGYTDIVGATGITYSPGTLTQTTYFLRVATCAASFVSSSTDPIAVSVISLSGTQNVAQNGNTSFSSTITGGVWASDNTSIATVNSSTGSITAGNTVGTCSITYTINGVTCSRSLFVSNTLPVTWSSFTGKAVNKQVILNWSTASETNSRDFLVMHSTNGVQWKEIGTAQAAGNSQNIRNYQFTHITPVEGNNAYQLFQRDLDGRTERSRIVNVVLGKGQSGLFVYPNPVENNRIYIQLTSASTILIYNSIGAEVYRQPLPIGTHTIILPKLAAGLYRVRAGMETRPLLIQ